MDKIWAAGQIPQELKGKVSAVMPRSEAIWADFERLAGEFVDRILPKINPKLKRQDCARLRPLIAAKIALESFKGLAATRAASAHEIAVAQHVIPNRDALDRMLRYETWIDRRIF